MNLTKNCRATHHMWHAYICCVRLCVCVPKHATTKGIWRILPGSKYVCHLQRNVKWKCREQRRKSQNQRNKYLPNNLAKTHTILCQLRSISLPLSTHLSRSHPSHSVCMSVSIHLCAEIRAIIFVTLT